MCLAAAYLLPQHRVLAAGLRVAVAAVSALFNVVLLLKWIAHHGAQASNVRIANLVQIVLSLGTVAALRTMPASLWQMAGVLALLAMVALPAAVSAAWFELTRR